MTIEDELVHAGAGGAAIEALQESRSWEARSADELRAIASRGLHGGDLYFAAMAELERRARDSEAAACARQAEAADGRNRQILLLAVLVTAVTAAFVLGYLVL
jgi:hypothetical protein